MNSNDKMAGGPKHRRPGRAGRDWAGKHHITDRAAARQAYRARIKSRLGKSEDERLADLWQQLYPFPIDPTRELPDRRGMIEDLADFAEALQPRVDRIQSDRLFRLIAKYAAGVSRQSAGSSVYFAATSSRSSAMLSIVSSSSSSSSIGSSGPAAPRRLPG